MKTNEYLKVGDSVNWCGAWGTQPKENVKVLAIELCKNGNKDGELVEQVSWKQILKAERNIVLTLDNNHWCYANQINCID